MSSYITINYQLQCKHCARKKIKGKQILAMYTHVAIRFFKPIYYKRNTTCKYNVDLKKYIDFIFITFSIKKLRQVYNIYITP